MVATSVKPRESIQMALWLLAGVMGPTAAALSGGWKAAWTATPTTLKCKISALYLGEALAKLMGSTQMVMSLLAIVTALVELGLSDGLQILAGESRLELRE